MKDGEYMPKSDFITTYQLQQMTPMIHFQSDEEGVTLRASEVKPKFDHFLIKILGGDEVEKGKQVAQENKWLIGSQSALKYKLRFEADRDTQAVRIPYKIFYANMGEERKENPLKMVIGACKMTIVCFIPSLKEFLDSRIEDFLISHTFGFMQGKGFGGYLPQKCDITSEKVRNALRTAYHCNAVYCADLELPTIVKQIKGKDEKYITPDNVFDNIIKPFHSLMKSGINYGGYERSYLFQYFHNNPEIYFGNEKACIKSNGIAPVVNRNPKTGGGENRHRVNSYKYVRALLGVTEEMEYIHALDEGGKPVREDRSVFDERGKLVKTINNIIKDKITISCNDKSIERYASPIRYRIIEKKLYVFAVPIDDELYDTQYTFGSSSGTTTIRVPLKDEFDIEDFLAEFVNHIQNSNNIHKVAKVFENINWEV
jgi:hypothetical protein